MFELNIPGTVEFTLVQKRVYSDKKKTRKLNKKQLSF
jgi:hypothetical protein